MKVLVTGANGFLGRGIVDELINHGIEVIATGRKIDLVNQKAYRVPSDLFLVDKPFDYFNKPDVLLHLAWNDGFNHNTSTHINNLPFHNRFIEDMLIGGVKNIVVMGSVHEIGFYEGSVDENTKCEPQSFYGIAKNSLRQSSELLCKKYNANLKWLRAYYIVKNDFYGNSVFSKIVQAANNNEKNFPFTMGLNQFDFIDYDIFCKKVCLCIIQNEYKGIINICQGRPEKLASRVERFIEENKLDIKLLYGTFKERPYDSKAIWGNSYIIDKIMEKYGVQL